MVGETQIQAQVKNAYSIASQAKCSGPFLNKLFHSAFSAGKKVRAETELGSGAISVSSAAVELACYIFGELSGKKAMLIGAGETAELVAKHFLDRGIEQLKIANRTHENAVRLAERYSADVVNFDDLMGEFFGSDIVVSATSGTQFLITKEMTDAYVKKNPSHRIVVIDIAVPRDIDPAIADNENIFVYDMDDLKSVVEKNINERKMEIPAAEKIVENCVGDYENWFKGMKAVPTIKFLQEKFEDIRQSEVMKNKICGGCAKRSEVDLLTKKIMKKVLWAPIKKLMKDTDCTEEELRYLREVFGGEDDNEEK